MGTNEMSTARVMEMTEFDRVADRFETSLRIANAMAGASLLPEHLRTRRVKTSKGIVTEDLPRDEIAANCVLLVNQAMRWGVDPFSLPGESYVIGGKLSFQGKLVAAIVNKRAGLKRNLEYSFSGTGDELTVTVSGMFIDEHQPRQVTLCVKDAKTDNPMWAKDPEQKLIYSGSIRWARRHCPEVLLGVAAEDESSEEYQYVDASSANPIADLMTHEPRETKAIEAQRTLYELVAECRDAIDWSENREQLQSVVEGIKADARLTDPARTDLIARAKVRWPELAEQAASSTEP